MDTKYNTIDQYVYLLFDLNTDLGWFLGLDGGV